MGATDPYIPTALAMAAGAYLIWALYRKFAGHPLKAGEEAILTLATCWIIAALPIVVLSVVGPAIHIQTDLWNGASVVAAIWGVAWVLGSFVMAMEALRRGER